MNGAANRKRGHRAELDVVHYLRLVGYPDARTTRAALGHDGAHAPGDVIGPVGLVCEVKDVAGSRWPTWCEQARVEAQGRPWVVVRRERGNPNVDDWPCRYGTASGAVGVWTFGAYLRWFEGKS